jgi:methylthioribose-1-phosphate isomerase
MIVNKTSQLSPLLWDDQRQIAKVIDQRLLPYELKYLEINTVEQMANAIKEMLVRGAPLIGIAAAFGMVLAAKNNNDLLNADKILRSTRPTAVNLMWALDEMQAILKMAKLDDKKNIFERLLQKALWIQEDDLARCKAIGEQGLALLSKFKKKLRIMTHCNAGALATAGYGTALGVVRSLFANNLLEIVYANETRPRQQGARLTVWELDYDGIPVILNTDNMAGYLMQQGLIDAVIVGADRITANGDVANKIGTYSLAVLAKYHRIPFYVAAPKSTFDYSIQNGSEIVIEQRSSIEVTHINGINCSVENIACVNPAFDTSPRDLITAIITEDGVINHEYS